MTGSLLFLYTTQKFCGLVFYFFTNSNVPPKRPISTAMEAATITAAITTPATVFLPILKLLSLAGITLAPLSACESGL